MRPRPSPATPERRDRCWGFQARILRVGRNFTLVGKQDKRKSGLQLDLSPAVQNVPESGKGLTVA